MTHRKPPAIRMPTDTEVAAIRKAIVEDPDARDLTDEDFAQMRRSGGTPGRPRPGRPAGSEKTSVTIRLDNRVIRHFKGDNPKGWQTRINEALKKQVG